MTRIPALTLIGLLLLAGCAGQSGVSVSRIDIRPLYGPGLVQWVGAGRDLPVQVTGNPTQLSQQDWSRTVSEALNASGWLSQTHMTSEPDGSQRGNFHVAVMFNAPVDIDDTSLCLGAADPETLVPVEGRSRIAMAFCNEGKPVSSAQAQTAAILSGDAPQMRAAMTQLLRQVFPPRNPNFPDRADFPLFP
jgi:hypothetical protein